jgi:BirA family biotin operon repressor/biotin-[acetyl-CoA-carboxylase] ligase
MPAEFNLRSLEEGILATRFEGKVRHFASVDSTNQMALIAAQGGAQWGVWIADEQTAGRGRGGHSWHSAPGDGIYMSALVTPSIPVSEARYLPMLAGLATQAAVREFTGLALDLRWPNDLMFPPRAAGEPDRKCGGILMESASHSAPDALRNELAPTLRYAVIGIGLNVKHREFPPELRAVATSLWLESGRLFEREALLAAMLRRLDEELKGFKGSAVAERFAAASSWVSGKRVRVGEDGGYTGWTRGLDANGFLRVEDDEGTMRTVLSGGVRSA